MLLALDCPVSNTDLARTVFQVLYARLILICQGCYIHDLTESS